MKRHIECGINTDPMNPLGKPSAAEIQGLGATWVRFTFKDDSVGAQPSAFPHYDGQVQELNQSGIKILMILSYETYPGKPAYEADDATWGAYIAKFAQRCGQIAQHYGAQVQAYQIWNEPDLPPEAARPDYDPRAREQVFGRMLKEAYTAIKAVSTSMVVAGGLASGQPSYLQAVTAATGGVLHADAVGVHPYGRRPSPNWPNPTWGGLGVLRDLLREYLLVTTKPLWISEFGTDDVVAQADFPRRTFEALDGDLARHVPCAFWYCWSDGMGPFGLVGLSGAKKPSYDSYRAFAMRPYEAPLVEVASVTLSAALLAKGEAEQKIQFNPQAALQRQIFADGFVPNSAEFPVQSNGVQYIAQRAEHLKTGEVRVYYAKYGDWEHRSFVKLPVQRVPVIDDPSAHWTDRKGHKARFIIVHSTDSPVGAPAVNTLKYLRGPNDRGVSVHELAMPEGKAYRMVADEFGAHHCYSQSVQFPDGTAPNLANLITWGIEGFQVHGRDTGQDVQATLVERVAAACARLGLTTNSVLAHRQIDPTRRDDPVGVDMTEFLAKVALTMLEDALAGQPEVQQPLIQFNPDAALQKRIFADGFVPNSNEFSVVDDATGIQYTAQRAEHLVTGEVRVYYGREEEGKWKVQFVVRGN